MAVVIRRVITPKRTYSVVAAVSLFVVLCGAVYALNPHDATNPISPAAQVTAKRLKSTQGVHAHSAGPAAVKLAKQQQVSQGKVMFVNKVQTGQSNPVVMWLPQATPRGYELVGFAGALAVLFVWVIRKRAGQSFWPVLLTAAFFTTALWSTQAATIRAPDYFVRWAATCLWEEKCKPDRLKQRMSEELVREPFVDFMYGTDNSAALKKHALAVQNGKPLPITQLRKYNQAYSAKLSDGDRELIANTTLGYAVGHNGLTYALGYMAWAFSALSTLSMFIALPLLLLVWAASRKKILRNFLKVFVGIHLGLFVTLALLTGYSWLGALIPTWFLKMDIFTWTASLGLLVLVSLVFVWLVGVKFGPALCKRLVSKFRARRQQVSSDD